jgi:hypothetical protein
VLLWPPPLFGGGNSRPFSLRQCGKRDNENSRKMPGGNRYFAVFFSRDYDRNSGLNSGGQIRLPDAESIYEKC